MIELTMKWRGNRFIHNIVPSVNIQTTARVMYIPNIKIISPYY